MSTLSSRTRFAIIVTLACLGSTAYAGDFQVAPTRLDLARRGATTELTLSNRGREAVNFEAKVVSWRQDAQGVMQLAPTKDIVVYPTLFTIKAGAKRAIRIASAVGQQSTEQTYRILVEELPSRRASSPQETTTSIAVRTQIGIPIFVAAVSPAAATAAGAIVGTVHAGQLTFAIHNRSTGHVKVASIRLTGATAAGALSFDRSQSGWYVLAGGRREYSLALGAGECAPTKQLAIEAVTDRGTWRTTFAMPAAGCPTAP